MARSPAARKHENDTTENDVGGLDLGGPGETGGVGASGGDGPTNFVRGNTYSGGDATDDGKKPKKTADEKKADFKRLMSGRMTRVVDALQQIGRLSNTQSYDWEAEQIERAVRTIREKVDALEASFAMAKAPAEGKKKTARQLSYVA